jgi:hypothetical protein
MTDPKQHRDEPDELDLDNEAIADLDVDDEDTEQVRGGYSGACAYSNNCKA